eukprot:UN19267
MGMIAFFVFIESFIALINGLRGDTRAIHWSIWTLTATLAAILSKLGIWLTYRKTIIP